MPMIRHQANTHDQICSHSLEFLHDCIVWDIIWPQNMVLVAPKLKGVHHQLVLISTVITGSQHRNNFGIPCSLHCAIIPMSSVSKSHAWSKLPSEHGHGMLSRSTLQCHALAALSCISLSITIILA